MPFGRYTCGVQRHIVLDGVPDPPWERETWGIEVPHMRPNRQSYAVTWRIQTTALGGLRFRLLPNYSGACYY